MSFFFLDYITSQQRYVEDRKQMVTQTDNRATVGPTSAKQSNRGCKLPPYTITQLSPESRAESSAASSVYGSMKAESETSYPASILSSPILSRPGSVTSAYNSFDSYTRSTTSRLPTNRGFNQTYHCDTRSGSGLNEPSVNHCSCAEADSLSSCSSLATHDVPANSQRQHLIANQHQIGYPSERLTDTPAAQMSRLNVNSPAYRQSSEAPILCNCGCGKLIYPSQQPYTQTNSFPATVNGGRYQQQPSYPSGNMTGATFETTCYNSNGGCVAVVPQQPNRSHCHDSSCVSHSQVDQVQQNQRFPNWSQAPTAYRNCSSRQDGNGNYLPMPQQTCTNTPPPSMPPSRNWPCGNQNTASSVYYGPMPQQMPINNWSSSSHQRNLQAGPQLIAPSAPIPRPRSNATNNRSYVAEELHQQQIPFRNDHFYSSMANGSQQQQQQASSSFDDDLCNLTNLSLAVETVESPFEYNNRNIGSQDATPNRREADYLPSTMGQTSIGAANLRSSNLVVTDMGSNLATFIRENELFLQQRYAGSYGYS